MKKVLVLILTLIISLSLIGCNNNPNEDYCIAGNASGVYICQKTLTSYFDTTINLKLYVDKNDDIDITNVFDYFENTIITYNQLFDKYHEYPGINNIYTINHSTEPVQISEPLLTAIKYVLDNENVTDSDTLPLFDIALGPVLNIWHDARENDACDNTTKLGISICPVPRNLIDNQSFNIDPNDVILDLDNSTISFAKPDMSIDLGGFAKGYVTEIIAEHLDSLNLSYILNAGNSNVRVGGVNKNRGGDDFIIALIKPSTDSVLTTDYYQTVAIQNGMNLVTSGNYQRFFIGEDDNLVYHHIIDPYTLYPGGECMSVTVLYNNAAMADILSTAIYLMPLNEAKTFVENYPGLEAIWYLYDNTYEYSSGFENYLHGLE